jgi:hypothetical protein
MKMQSESADRIAEVSTAQPLCSSGISDDRRNPVRAAARVSVIADAAPARIGTVDATAK